MFLGAIFSSNMHSLSRSETENALPLPQLNLTVSPDVHDSIAFPNMCHCYILDKRKTVALSQVSCTIAISGSRSTLESSLWRVLSRPILMYCPFGSSTIILIPSSPSSIPGSRQIFDIWGYTASKLPFAALLSIWNEWKLSEGNPVVSWLPLTASYSIIISSVAEHRIRNNEVKFPWAAQRQSLITSRYTPQVSGDESLYLSTLPFPAILGMAEHSEARDDEPDKPCWPSLQLHEDPTEC